MEDIKLEYKDFSEIFNTKAEIKKVKFKLAKEIIAFANQSGGKIIVGKNDFGVIVQQPEYIINILKSDCLQQWINNYSDKLVQVVSIENKSLKIVEIDVYNSTEIISITQDSSEFCKGDIYYRKNSECKKASGGEIKRLLKTKSLYDEDKKIKILKAIVHKKFSNKTVTSSDINIFDSMVILDNSTKFGFEEIKYLFDNIALMKFFTGLNIPYSKFFTLTNYLDILNMALKNPNLNYVWDFLNNNREVQRNIINSEKEKILNSREFDNYII
jgi:hypothetical protein